MTSAWKQLRLLEPGSVWPRHVVCNVQLHHLRAVSACRILPHISIRESLQVERKMDRAASHPGLSHFRFEVWLPRLVLQTCTSSDRSARRVALGECAHQVRDSAAWHRAALMHCLNRHLAILCFRSQPAFHQQAAPASTTAQPFGFKDILILRYMLRKPT